MDTAVESNQLAYKTQDTNRMFTSYL